VQCRAGKRDVRPVRAARGSQSAYAIGHDTLRSPHRWRWHGFDPGAHHKCDPCDFPGD